MRHLLGVPRQLVQHSTKKSSGALRVRNAAEASSVVCGQHVGSCGCACSLQLSVNEPGHVTHAAFDVKQLVLRPDGSLISTDGVRLLRKHGRAFPWLGGSLPAQTPHHHPLLDRLLRHQPEDHG